MVDDASSFFCYSSLNASTSIPVDMSLIIRYRTDTR